MIFLKIFSDKPPHSTHFVHVFSIEKVIQPHRSLAIYQNYSLMFRRKYYRTENYSTVNWLVDEYERYSKNVVVTKIFIDVHCVILYDCRLSSQTNVIVAVPLNKISHGTER